MTTLPNWTDNSITLTPQPPPSIRAWLIKSYIISKALKQITPGLTVEVIQQDFNIPHPDEALKFNLNLNFISSSALPLIRRIHLRDDTHRYTYARVIIPHATYQQEAAHLTTLGAQFIGEKMLYGRSDTIRSQFEFSVILPHHLLYQEATAYFGQSSQKISDYLYARRSVFTLGTQPLLLVEVFLPTLPEYPL
jgi:chorismate-pyruvate lyase